MTDYMQQGAPMPASIGRCADLYRDVRDVRLAMEKEVERVKARESEIREHMINTLGASPDSGAAGLRYRAQLVKKREFKFIGASEELPNGGWNGFTSWVRKHDRFDMIQKRLNSKAVADFYDQEGKLPAGVESLLVPDISVTKI